MLNGGVLDQSTISVHSNDVAAPKLANVQPNTAANATASTSGDHHDEIEQEGEIVLFSAERPISELEEAQSRR